MIRRRVVLALLSLGAVAATAPTEDAGWPCDADAKPLSAPAAYWPGAERTDAAGWSTDAPVASLARDVTRRSIEEADAVVQVRRFAQARPAAGDRAKLAAAMIGTIDGERQSIIDGIRRFNVRQGQLAKRIEEGYAALDVPAITAERRVAVEEQAKWDQRIFEDRQRMLPIVCRQPGALEQRLTALLAALKSG
ncbi:hypothetical protein [Sphingomonas sp.]|jgi:hypothetical protein|uniref:hypothetical protein n=1 Tax=Sphingomonas sp. TaxID=28214 RepID=UPI002EDAA98F